MSQVVRVIAGSVGTHVVRLGPLRVPKAEKGTANPLLPESSKAGEAEIDRGTLPGATLINSAGRRDGTAVARIDDASAVMFDQLTQTSNSTALAGT